MKASQEPLEETKVGDGGLVVYPTLPGKPVQSQDTLGRKLLKACAGSNPTWIGAPSFFHALVRFLCPHETGARFLLCKANAFERPAYKMETGCSLPSLAVPQLCPMSAF